MPRLGCRLNDKKNGRNRNGETRLPDKLIQALKTLRPSVLSHVSHFLLPFKKQGSNYIDAADDVIYYSNSEQYRNRRSQRLSISFATHVSSPRSTLPLQPNTESVNTFEQIRQLYKSVPNLSTTYKENPREANSAVYHANSLCRKNMCYESARNAVHNSSPYLDTTASPTDSGYRSAPRMPSHSLSTLLLHRRSDYSSSQKAMCHQRREHITERVHEPTIVFANCSSVERSSPLQISHYSTCSTTSSRPFIQNYDFECLSREFVFTSPKDTGNNPLSKSFITINEKIKKFDLSEGEIMEVFRRGRCKEHCQIINRQAVLKLKKYLENALYALVDEIRRLSLQFIKCRVLDIKTAVKVLFNGSVAESCTKAGIQATSIYALSGSGALKTSMQRRAGLCFNLGHFYKWMIESQISEIILDEAAVFLCAVLECLLEEIILACVESKSYEGNVTTDALNKMLDCENNIRKFLAENKERIILEGEVDFTTTNHQRCSNKLSRLSTNNESQLIKLLQMKGIERNNIENLEIDLPASYNSSTLNEWIRISEAYAAHHASDTVDEDDVRQAARILLNIDCPPRFLDFRSSKISLEGSVKSQHKLTQEIAFQLLRVNSEETISMALDFLGPARLRNLDSFGLTALSEAILIDNNRAANAIISATPDLNTPVPNEQNVKNSSALSMDFAGWTSLTWAIAQRNYPLTVRLIDACAQVENNSMTKETPLQVAAILGDADIVRKLLKCHANPFRTTINYDSMKCNYRHMGSPSAVALAAAYNHRNILRMMLSAGANYKCSEENLSLKDFLNQNEMAFDKNKASFNLQSNMHSFLDIFNKEQKQALNEAMYYAAETWHIDIAMDLRKIGVAWNLHTWTTCLQAACVQLSRNYKLLLLNDFNFRLADDLMHDDIRETATLLFDIIRSECPSATKELRQTAAIISSFYRRICAGQITTIMKSDNLESQGNNNHKSMIDPSYVNNPDLSDITFLVANKVFYGHRIVLTNTSNIFRKLLDNNSNQIHLDNISYETFHLVMMYLYSGGQLEVMDEYSLSRQLELVQAALRFGLNTLKCERYDLDELKNECSTYIFKYMSSVLEDKRIRILLQHRDGQTDYCAELLNIFLESYQNHGRKTTNY
ncbi:unnamed protein product [Cercopithifilaria johnstoni]|uniref:BTB domain-containing protein n=1 Tax=Cercopithifilaria johnstoni TaxID=2874296 RepID=A0A8J2QA00_9BILA|nr:unnamed protein product [Cercopithifilaria johnstoni]